MNIEERIEELALIEAQITVIEFYLNSKVYALKLQGKEMSVDWRKHAEKVIKGYTKEIAALHLSFAKKAKELSDIADKEVMPPPNNVTPVGKGYLTPTIYPAAITEVVIGGIHTDSESII